MTDDPRSAALVFLLGQHLLPRAEAEAALRVAENVLRTGLDHLDTAIAAGNATACQEASHALKGTLLNLGLTRLANLTHQIQDAAHDDHHRCQTLARELATQLAPFFVEA